MDNVVDAIQSGGSDVDRTLTGVKSVLVRAFPFLAFIVVTTDFVLLHSSDEDDDARQTNERFTAAEIPTMGATIVRGRPTVYINANFMMNTLTNREERAFVIAHELLHIFFEHLGRQTEQGYHHTLWNIATDYCINYMLEELQSPHLKFPAFGGLYDTKYADMSSDQIYNILKEDFQKRGQEMLDGFGEPGENGNSPFDDVSTVTLSPEQKADLQAALSAALQSGQAAGTMKNSSLVKALYDMITPSINWREQFADYVTNAKDEYSSYKSYNPRSQRVIFPSSDGCRIHVMYAIDTSGSMSDEDVAEGLSQIKHIVSDYANWTVQFITCDVGVETVGVYHSENGDEFGDFCTEFGRGGGTDMNPIIEHANEVDDPPDVVVIHTDGYLTQQISDSDIPVIVVVTESGNQQFKSDCHNVVFVK